MKQFRLICLLLLLQTPLLAHNIQVANVQLADQDSTAGFTRVVFDLSWQNSWRYSLPSGINNWDAAWVFVKFRVGGVDYVSAPGATNAGNIVTVNTTTGLRPGMPVHVSAGTGSFPAQAVVSSILDQERFTVSVAPTTPLSGGAVVTANRVWEHAWLGDNGSHVAGSGTAANYEKGLLQPGTAYDPATNPGLGVFIYRSAEGYGTVNITDIRLRWNYAQQGLSHDDIVEVQVFAIEMVYVPLGAFFAGDGSSTQIQGQFRNGDENAPLRIQTEAALTLGGVATGNLANNDGTGMAVADDYDNGNTQSLGAHFPKGVAAFYAMKYEISQKQYVDFLNTLTRLQQHNRTASDLSPGTSSVSNTFVMSNTSSLTARNGIRCASSISANGPISFFNDLNGNGTGDEANDGQFVACNYLSWFDVAAYLDWSALRPMTELEFEKAARGQIPASAQEYAWGSNQITAATGLNNPGAANELASNAGSNAAFGNEAGLGGPVRVGAFAAADSGRTVGGFAFWGLAELSGNVAEIVISTGHPSGRAFDGRHGNGFLIAADSTPAQYGDADVTNWPFTAAGTGTRGGSWFTDAQALRVASRVTAANAAGSRSNSTGGRGVRTVGCSGPAGTPIITGNSIPLGESAVFTASGAGSSYWWIVPAGWEIVAGQGTATAEIYANGPGQIRVAALNDCGTGEEVVVNVTVN